MFNARALQEKFANLEALGQLSQSSQTTTKNAVTHTPLPHFNGIHTASNSQNLADLESLQGERHQQAEDDYLRGLTKLQQAQKQAFQDKQTLASAYRFFATAIRKNCREVRYQTAMAYLLLLLNQPLRAAHYIGKALNLDPGNERALLLQQSLQRVQQASPDIWRGASWNVFDNLAQPEQSHDYDDLFDSVEAFINQEVRLMMQAMVSPEVTLNQDLFEKQEQVFEQLSALEDMIQAKIRILDLEIDTQSLERLLKPLWVLQQRFYKALEHHALLRILLDGILGAQQEAQELYQTLKNDPNLTPQIHSQLEALYDICDELADSLDETAKQTSIHLIEVEYENMAHIIGKIQSLLDEA